MKETDPFICEWCNREIKEVKNQTIPSLGIEITQGKAHVTMINYMHVKCLELAIPAINKFIEDECIKNDCNESFNPYE